MNCYRTRIFIASFFALLPPTDLPLATHNGKNTKYVPSAQSSNYQWERLRLRPYEYPFGLAKTTNFSLWLSENPTHGVGFSDTPILAGEVTQ